MFARHTFLPHTSYVQQRMNNEGNMILGPLMHLGPFSLRAPQGLVPPTSEIISPALTKLISRGRTRVVVFFLFLAKQVL